MFQEDSIMFDKAIQNFHSKLDAIVTREQDYLPKSVLGIKLCNSTLTKLKTIVEKEDFETVPAEINFFKNIKSLPMSYLIYFSEIRDCELRKPKAGTSFQIRFFEKEIRKVNKFFSKNSDFVHYMEQNHTYLDHQLFSRNHRNNFPFTPMINYYQFPEFSTSHDMLRAKVQAMYRFIHYIREAMQHLKPGGTELYAQKRHKILLWSGSKTALIELIYALHANGVINHGTADLSTITSSFEDFFNIKLDNIYKTWSEIKARKGERAKFLNELSVYLEQKMERDDEV